MGVCVSEEHGAKLKKSPILAGDFSSKFIFLPEPAF